MRGKVELFRDAQQRGDKLVRLANSLPNSGNNGTTLAQAIRGQSERLDLFAKIDHRPFPGGRALRTPLLVAAMAWYKLRDALW